MNMKQNRNTIRLTESRLKQIVAESVRKVLNEDIGNGLHEDLSSIIQSLEELADSKYIPFSSPSPSSTESIVKRNVNKAIELLYSADDAAQSLYHGVSRY